MLVPLHHGQGAASLQHGEEAYQQGCFTGAGSGEKVKGANVGFSEEVAVQLGLQAVFRAYIGFYGNNLSAVYSDGRGGVSVRVRVRVRGVIPYLQPL